MPRPTPVEGIESVATFLRFLRNPLACIAELHRTKGEIVIIDLPFTHRADRETVLLADPNAIESVLKRTNEFRTSGVSISGPPGSAQKRLRMGIVRANGDEHRRLRNAYSSYFERVDFIDLPARILSVVRDEIETWPVDQFVDLPPLIDRLVLRMAIASLFPEGDLSRSMEVAARIEYHSRAGFAKGVLAFPFDLPGTPYRRLLARAAIVEQAIIDWANAYPIGDPAPNLMDAIHDAVGVVRGRACWRVAAQIVTLFGASFETCASTLLWTLYLLAQHPEWVERVRSSASDILNSPNPEPNALLELTDLDFVIRESMRILTPVPYQRRVAVCDIELAGMRFARKTKFILSDFVVNRSPTLYPEPATFLPERWKWAAPNAFQYLTFSAGPRRCLGYWMAMGILKTALATVISRRQIEVKAGQSINTIVSVTLKPSTKFYFSLRPHYGERSNPVVVRGHLGQLVNVR